MYNYPRPKDKVPNIFTEQSGKHALEQVDRALIQQFCDGCHWHNLVLIAIGPEKRAYYWDVGAS